MPDGTLNACETLRKERSDIKIDNNGKMVPTCRHPLKNGYVVGCGDRYRVFTNITYDEYVKYCDKHGTNHWPYELIEPRIIDRKPYIEYYEMGCLNCGKKEFTLKQIYEMLEKGTIEDHFTRLK